MQPLSYAHHQFPPAVIQHAVWLYLRFTLSDRDVDNVLEHDHRGVKGRYSPMRGFKAFEAAHRFCRAFDEVRNFLRPAHYLNQKVSLACRRAIHVQRVAALRDPISTA
jgi:transposase-like protein